MTIITDPLKAARLDITSARGVPFMILVDVAADLIEFWDLRYPMTHFNRDVHERIGKIKMPGQFVARYDIETIARPNGGGALCTPLALGREVDGWRIDGQAMALVRKWLHFIVARANSVAAEGS